MTYFEAMNKCYDEDVKIKRPHWGRGEFIYFINGIFILRLNKTNFGSYPDKSMTDIIERVMYRTYGYTTKKLNNANIVIPDFLVAM